MSRAGSIYTLIMADSLGIVGWDSFHFIVSDLARSRRFYTEALGFTEVARASKTKIEKGGEEASVFGAGHIRVLVSSPVRKDSRAARYLRIHPDGISSLALRVKDIGKAWAFLEKRGATFLSDIATDETKGPLPDVQHRDAARRRDLSVHGARGEVPAPRAGLRNDRRRAAGGEPARLRHDRPRHVERVHDAARRELVPRRAGLHALLGRGVPHRRSGRREEAHGLRPEVDRHGRSGERPEAGHERAAEAVLAGRARSTASARTTTARACSTSRFS